MDEYTIIHDYTNANEHPLINGNAHLYTVKSYGERQYDYVRDEAVAGRSITIGTAAMQNGGTNGDEALRSIVSSYGTNTARNGINGTANGNTGNINTTAGNGRFGINGINEIANGNTNATAGNGALRNGINSTANTNNGRFGINGNAEYTLSNEQNSPNGVRVSRMVENGYDTAETNGTANTVGEPIKKVPDIIQYMTTGDRIQETPSSTTPDTNTYQHNYTFNEAASNYGDISVY
ncbi:MAG: hypothetical protein LBQ05_00245 [Christensenellaceae bacterium]|jgi:hypothetical protein|nr:hypothetical protein [Christensenellaceae bacterium]